MCVCAHVVKFFLSLVMFYIRVFFLLTTEICSEQQQKEKNAPKKKIGWESIKQHTSEIYAVFRYSKMRKKLNQQNIDRREKKSVTLCGGMFNKYIYIVFCVLYVFGCEFQSKKIEIGVGNLRIKGECVCVCLGAAVKWPIICYPFWILCSCNQYVHVHCNL